MDKIRWRGEGEECTATGAIREADRRAENGKGECGGRATRKELELGKTHGSSEQRTRARGSRTGDMVEEVQGEDGEWVGG